MMADDMSFEWRRPATEIEIFCDCASRKSFFVTVYGLSVCSSSPLDDGFIQQALVHLFRKVPSLRTCFRKRGDILWACEMKHEHVDFQVTDTKDLVTAAEDLFHFQFPTTEGPNWCARLLPSTADAPLPCSRREDITSGDFPYIRTLLLAVHHGIADGTTNIFTIESFLHILDDMIAGRPIDDKAQMGKVTDGETKAILMTMMEQLKKGDKRLQDIVENNKKSCKAEKLIPRAFPMPMDPNCKSQLVFGDLDKEITQTFLKRCKQEKVTVNSAMTAIMNVSLVDLVREGGLEQDTYLIHEVHAVNMRRYWSGNTKGTLGCNIHIPHSFFPTPAKWREDFWGHARTVHANIVQGIEEKEPFMSVAKLVGESCPESLFEERPYPESDYGVGNVGNLNRVITTKRQHVRLCHLVRSTSSWNDPMYSFFHTLDDCFAYSIAYLNDILTREKAKRLLSITFDNIKAVTQQ